MAQAGEGLGGSGIQCVTLASDEPQLWPNVIQPDAVSFVRIPTKIFPML